MALIIESNQTIPLHASYMIYDDDYFATRPLLLLCLKNWIDNDSNNVINNNRVSLFSATFGISKNDNEALQRLWTYIDQKGGNLAFQRKPVYLLSFGYALFVYATQFLKEDLVTKVESNDDSWIDLLASDLNAGDYTAKIIKENVPLSKNILKEWNAMASFEDNLKNDKGLISLFLKKEMYSLHYIHFRVYEEISKIHAHLNSQQKKVKKIFGEHTYLAQFFQPVL